MWRNRRTPATLFVALLCLIGEVQPAAARVRAASINLCADQYLLALAPREDIVAVTPPAADPARSGEAARAAGIPVDHGTAEEIVRLKPDLVLADGFSDSATVALIRRLGIPVLVLPSPTSFEGIIANVRLAARALDRQEDGEELIRGVGASLQADARAEGAKAPPIVAALEPGGLIEGRGTLIDQAIRLAGGASLGASLGISGYAEIPLESLISSRTDLLIEPMIRGRAPSLSLAALDHPAIRDRFRATPVLRIPGYLLDCPAPRSAELVPMIRRALHGPAGESES